MENASKALIMAGGLLISILVASFMIFVLRKAGSLSAEYDTQISDNELAKFNSQFEAYAKADNTFFDVITVANLAYDINKRNGWDEQNGVSVKICTDPECNNVQYSILPNENSEKNHFFEGMDPDKKVYIYNEKKPNLEGKSIVDYYTAGTETETGFKYERSFKCDNKIHYNSITGKVDEIKFQIVENN